MAYPDFLLDKRVVHRNLEKGLIDTKTLDSHIKNLPDMEANAEACTPDPPEEETAEDGEAAEAVEGEAIEAGGDEE